MADKPKKGIWNLYEKKGDTLERKNVTCPKCGQGYFMAQHKDRNFCGQCGYTEFKKREKPAEAPAEKKDKK